MNCYRDFSSVTVTFRRGVPKKQFHSLNKNWRRLSKRFLSLYRSKLWNNSLFLVKIFIGDGEFLYFLYCTCCCMLFKSPWFITFWPINVFYAQVVTVWAWCSSLWGGVLPTPCQGWSRLDLGVDSGKLTAVVLWALQILTEEPGLEMPSTGEKTKQKAGPGLTEKCRCARWNEQRAGRGNKPGRGCGRNRSETCQIQKCSKTGRKMDRFQIKWIIANQFRVSFRMMKMFWNWMVVMAVPTLRLSPNLPNSSLQTGGFYDTWIIPQESGFIHASQSYTWQNNGRS